MIDADDGKLFMDPKKGVPFAVVNGVKIHGFSEDAYSRALDSR